MIGDDWGSLEMIWTHWGRLQMTGGDWGLLGVHDDLGLLRIFSDHWG